jgi:hypothetical protein
MPTPYPTLTSPAINARAVALHLNDKLAAAIAAPRGLVAAPVFRTAQLLGCTETYLSPLTVTFTIPAQYGNRNILAVWSGSCIMSVGDYVQVWINAVTGGSLPALGSTNRLKAINVFPVSAGGQSSYYGILRAWNYGLPPGTYTYSVSAFGVGPNCATGGPFANGTTDKMKFAIEDRGAA